jgi:hypothetical protein
LVEASTIDNEKFKTDQVKDMYQGKKHLKDKLKRIEREGEQWNTSKPPPNEPVRVLCSDFMGDYTMEAVWVPYSLKGPKRQHGKGRWMKRSKIGTFDTLGRKETPEGWLPLTPPSE